MKKIFLIMLLLLSLVSALFAENNDSEKTNQSKEIILNFERINAGYNLQKCYESEFPNEFLSEQSPGSLLELAYEFAENGNLEDAAMGFIPFMREHFKDTDIDFVKADAGDLPFDDGSFDTVCISNSLHHLPDLEKINPAQAERCKLFYIN